MPHNTSLCVVVASLLSFLLGKSHLKLHRCIDMLVELTLWVADEA